MKKFNFFKLFNLLIYEILLDDKWVKKSIFVTSCLVLLGTILNIILPGAYKLIIDYLNIKNNSYSYIFLILIIYCLITIVNSLISPLRELLSMNVAEKLITKIQLNFFCKLQNPNYFSDNNGSAINLMGRIQLAIDNLFCDVLFFILPSLIEIVISIIILLIFYPLKYSIILSCVTVIYISTILISSKKSIKYQQHENSIKDKATDFLINNLNNIELVRLTNNINSQLNLFQKILNHKQKILKLSFIFQYLVKITEILLLVSGSLIALVFCVIDVSSNIITVGDLTLIISYSTQFFFPLRFLGLIFLNLQKNFFSLEKILNTDRNQEIVLSKINYKLNKTDILFSNVDFQYPSSNTLSLKNVSFKINHQEKTCLIGKSGSGKSTIYKILLKFFPPNSGVIYFDENNLNDLNQDTLYQQISVTPQRLMLFNNTILYNLRYFNNDAPMNLINDICSKLGILDYILSLPDKFNTIINDHDSVFSLGQKQLLSIARCLLKPAEVYIFDEPTSFLDPISEQKVVNAIKDCLDDKTIIMITHNINLCKKFDKIIVLENGIMSEMGSHLELLKRKQEYYKLLFVDMV